VGPLQCSSDSLPLVLSFEVGICLPAFDGMHFVPEAGRGSPIGAGGFIHTTSNPKPPGPTLRNGAPGKEVVDRQ
jgi:hypothetical protein